MILFCGRTPKFGFLGSRTPLPFFRRRLNTILLASKPFLHVGRPLLQWIQNSQIQLITKCIHSIKTTVNRTRWQLLQCFNVVTKSVAFNNKTPLQTKLPSLCSIVSHISLTIPWTANGNFTDCYALWTRSSRHVLSFQHLEEIFERSKKLVEWPLFLKKNNPLFCPLKLCFSLLDTVCTV